MCYSRHGVFFREFSGSLSFWTAYHKLGKHEREPQNVWWGGSAGESFERSGGHTPRTQRACRLCAPSRESTGDLSAWRLSCSRCTQMGGCWCYLLDPWAIPSNMRKLATHPVINERRPALASISTAAAALAATTVAHPVHPPVSKQKRKTSWHKLPLQIQYNIR